MPAPKCFLDALKNALGGHASASMEFCLACCNIFPNNPTESMTYERAKTPRIVISAFSNALENPWGDRRKNGIALKAAANGEQNFIA